MWPIQLAFGLLISCRIFLCSSTLCNTSSFLTWLVQLIFSSLLRHHIYVTQNKCEYRQILVTFWTSLEQNGLPSIDAKAFTINTPRKFLTVGLPWADCDSIATVEMTQNHPPYKYTLHCSTVKCPQCFVINSYERGTHKLKIHRRK